MLRRKHYGTLCLKGFKTATSKCAKSRSSLARNESQFQPRTLRGFRGGLVAVGISAFQGTRGTCHDSSNFGNHSFRTPLEIGTGDPSPTSLFVNMGGLDISYLPTIVACKTDPATGLASSTCKTTTGAD